MYMKEYLSSFKAMSFKNTNFLKNLRKKFKNMIDKIGKYSYIVGKQTDGKLFFHLFFAQNGGCEGATPLALVATQGFFETE